MVDSIVRKYNAWYVCLITFSTFRSREGFDAQNAELLCVHKDQREGEIVPL
ncbi:MAG: hypothetical protein ACI8RD_011550 [Bacillariaceae sp.]|jgi:hypothetical protein